MKTAELIPMILLELSDGAKYGIELTKSIETKSNGKVVIKQPTLYTILKKLEKSKFISSYWEDSEIGGKRHYYKLTQYGNNQVSTLPSFSVLLENALKDDDSDIENQNSISESKNELDIQFEQNETTSNSYSESIQPQKIEFDNFSASNSFDDVFSSLSNSTNLYEKQEDENDDDLEALRQERIKQSKIESSETKYVSIMDLLVDDKDENTNQIKLNQDTVEIKESVLPSSEVFSNNSIDTATEVEINQQNTTVLKDNSQNKEENFATNDNVSKFTQTNFTMLSDEYKSKLRDVKKDNSVENFLTDNVEYKADVSDEIKYVDYVNLKSDKSYVYSKKLTKNMLYRLLSTCAYLIAMLIICAISVNYLSASPLYYIFLIASIGFIMFSITLFLSNAENFRLKHKEKPLKIDIKKHIIIATAVFIAIFIICVIVSVNSGVENIFALSNFANLYAPLIIGTTLYIDILFSYIFLVKRI